MKSEADRRRTVAAYGKLVRKLESGRRQEAFAGSIPDIAGAFISEDIHRKLVDLLRSSLQADVGDDATRMLLAYEYWRAGKAADATREYELVVTNGQIQSVIAARMIESIRSANTKTADK